MTNFSNLDNNNQKLYLKQSMFACWSSSVAIHLPFFSRPMDLHRWMMYTKTELITVIYM